MKLLGRLHEVVDTFRHSHLPHGSLFEDPKVVLLIAGALLVVFFYFSGIFLVVPNLVSILGMWRMPHLSTEMLEPGFLIRDISWLTAIKLIIFLAVLWVIFKGVKDHL